MPIAVAAVVPPDFTPIEHAFATIKSHLPTAQARTFDTLVAAIGHSLDPITPADAHDCVAQCGFALSHQPV